MTSFILQVRKKVSVVKHFLFYYDFNSFFFSLSNPADSDMRVTIILFWLSGTHVLEREAFKGDDKILK